MTPIGKGLLRLSFNLIGNLLLSMSGRDESQSCLEEPPAKCELLLALYIW